MSLDNLYPTISFPVSQGTPMIGSLVKWNHTQSWSIPACDLNEKETKCERSFLIDVNAENFEYMSGHIIDGK